MTDKDTERMESTMKKLLANAKEHLACLTALQRAKDVAHRDAIRADIEKIENERMVILREWDESSIDETQG
jgi:hypothetical protein